MVSRISHLVAFSLIIVAWPQLGWTQPPAAPVASLDAGKLKLEVAGAEPRLVELPCEASSVEQQGDLVYVACHTGVVPVDVSDPAAPRVLGLREMGGPVSGLFVRGGEVWAELVRVEARPVSAALREVPSGPIERPRAPTPTQKATPTKPAPAAAAVGEVVVWRNGEVVVALGTDAGILRGGHVEIFTEHEVDLGDGEQSVREERVAVGRVLSVTHKRAVVELGLNERVPKGAKARWTNKHITGTQIIPPRVGGLWSIDGNFRPFLALGTFGFGTISDLSVGYRATSPLHLSARFEPLGLGLAEEGNIVAFAGNVLAGYDTSLFEVGLGLGWSAVNDAVEDDGGVAEIAAGPSIPSTVDHVRSGMSISQAIRLGSLDGVNLSAYNAFLLFDGEFHYGGTTASLQLPVTDTSWLFFRGGGGIAGYGYGEIGLRVLTLGNGDHGSLFLSPSLGGAYLFGEADQDCDKWVDGKLVPVKDGCVDEIGYGGPMVGLGVEWRQ